MVILILMELLIFDRMSGFPLLCHEVDMSSDVLDYMVELGLLEN